MSFDQNSITLVINAVMDPLVRGAHNYPRVNIDTQNLGDLLGNNNVNQEDLSKNKGNDNVIKVDSEFLLEKLEKQSMNEHMVPSHNLNPNESSLPHAKTT
ncbi:uncharacterized protein G2W53_009513 [Senna tora]|uniref:Uncharacterized protein n=1 Tax=Senna tora TaxID=362788 RepID=A0A834WY13_9FABA|nr:uncharacterized protein G2W53_009513 [Senna tora]